MTREEAILIIGEHKKNADRLAGKTLAGQKSAEAFNMAIEALSTSEIPNKWIPVSERLPEKEGKYLVCIEYKHKGVFVERYQMTADFYRFSHIDMSWCPDNENAAGDIVAWMPLPESYKPQESEDTE